VIAVLAAIEENASTLRPWAVFLPLVFWVLARMAGLYRRDEYVINKTTLDEGPKLLSVAAIFAVIAVGERGIWFKAPVQPLVIWASLTLCLFVARGLARFVAARITPPERVLIIGDAASTARIDRAFARSPGLNAVVAGRIAADSGAEPGEDDEWLLGAMEDLKSVLREHRVERVVVVFREAGGDQGVEVVRLAKACGVKVAVLPPLLEVMGSSVEYDDLGGQALLSMRPFGLTPYSRALKRTFDLIVAGSALVALSPVLLVIALAVKLTSHGKVIFRQTRIGRDGRPFKMMKFRTMVDGAEQHKHRLLEHNEAAPMFKIANDPRTTRVGRFLRRQSLDELPQLLNILRGDMSIVGPRPLVAEEDRLFSGWQRHRNHVAPGITGPWQVLGSTRVPWTDMVILDYLYGANWSLWLDLRIILRTIPAILSQRSGEYPSPQR
jgi:exopolysaccharide biosynthesis polyprenyl glycosylphosphotransferase